MGILLKLDVVDYSIGYWCTPMTRDLYTDRVYLYTTFKFYVWSIVSETYFLFYGMIIYEIQLIYNFNISTPISNLLQKFSLKWTK